MTTDDLQKLRADCDGFRGRFFYDAERGDLAYVAKDCDERQCDCAPSYNSDGDQDCSVSLETPDSDVAEAIARMLNAVPMLLDEIDRLRKDAQSARLETITAIGEAGEMRRLALEACDIADHFDEGYDRGVDCTRRQRLAEIRASLGGEGRK